MYLSENPTGIKSGDIIAIDNLRKSTLFSSNGNVHLNFNTSFSGMIKITVYDLQGKVLRHLPVDINNSKSACLWEGCDISGNYAASGCYIIRLEYAGRCLTRNVMLQR